MATTALVLRSAHVSQASEPLLSDEDMRANRDIRDRIVHFLDTSKMLIDQKIATRGRQEEMISFSVAVELGERRLSRERVASIIRNWIFERYKGRVGLDVYETTFNGSMIRLRV